MRCTSTGTMWSRDVSAVAALWTQLFSRRSLLASWIPSVHKAGAEEQWEAWSWRFDLMLMENKADVLKKGERDDAREGTSRRRQHGCSRFRRSLVVEAPHLISFSPWENGGFEQLEVESRRVFKMMEIFGGILLEADDDGWAASLNDARRCNWLDQHSCGDGRSLSPRVCGEY